MGVVADRTCPSCGADVSSASGFCPRCGADLEARLIELGGGTPVRARRTPRRDRPRRSRLLAGLAAVVVGGLAVTTLVDDDSDGGGDADPGAVDDDEGATTTTSGDLAESAPLLGEDSGVFVALRGQANVVVLLDLGVIVDLDTPFRPSSAAGDTVVSVSDLGVQLWSSLGEESRPVLIDELGAEQTELGDTVVWAISEGEARAIRRDGSGVVVSVPLPSGGEPVGVLGDALVLSAPAGTFTVGLDGNNRLTDGVPLDAAFGHLLVSRCDDALSCTVETVDGAGTLLQSVPLDGPAPITAAAVGPQGEVAWISGQPGDGYVYVDGRSRFPLPATGILSLDWSPDGRWLIGSFGRSVLWVLDTTEGPDAAPAIVDLELNVYPEEVFVFSDGDG